MRPSMRGTMFEGGHYTLATRAGDGEPISLPDGRTAWACTTDTTRRCFALAVEARGEGDGIGLMVGDLAIRERLPGGAWAIPPSYREVLARRGVPVEAVTVWGEAYARNQGKRRLLDPARSRSPRDTYEKEGWALFVGSQGTLCLASDASLAWDGDLRVAVLARGAAPLCPLVFAGLKRAIAVAGWARHVAIYAPADDPWIDTKLRAGAAAVAQLFGVGEQEDRLVGLDAVRVRRHVDLVAPGELPWDDFRAEVARVHPGLTPLEDSWRASPTSACGATSATSRCSG